MLADASSEVARGNVLTVWRIVYAQKGFQGYDDHVFELRLFSSDG